MLKKHEDEELMSYEPLVPMFKEMGQLAQILREKRMRRGAIDFEAKVLVDEEGKPTDVVMRDRSVSEKFKNLCLLRTKQ